jgi:oligoendopeptidase F
MVSAKTMAAVLLAVFLFALTPKIGRAQTGEAPTRDKIAEKYKWDLSEYYPSDSAWQVEFEALKNRIPDMESFQGKIGKSSHALASCLALNDTLKERLSILYSYASLKQQEDTRVGKYQEMNKQALMLYSEVGQAGAFIEPEILTIPDSTLKSYITNNKALTVYRFYLNDVSRRRAHVGTPEIENLLAMAGPALQGPYNIFTMIDDADIVYPNIKDESGQEIQLTKGRYGQILESPNRQLRREASAAVNKETKKYLNTASATQAASVDCDVFISRARGYNNCLEYALNGDSIPLEVFNNLIKAVNDNLAPLHKYAALRKKVLAVDTLFGFDLSVPLVPPVTKEYNYEAAEKIVLDGLKPLGTEYLKNVQMALNSRWIDVYETQGKGSGAFTAGTYGVHPVMLLNYSNTLTDVFTLAHEMGHMMHDYYTQENEPSIYSGHSLFTAEVASTCNEAIMIKYMLKHAKTKEEKLYLLNYYIEQIIGTFYTQVWFSEYELKIHETVEKGDALSADVLRKYYRDIYQKYYGPDVFIPEGRDIGGMFISHFYYQLFYVYQYATSYAASELLSQKIMDGDPKAIKAYNEFIKTGSSDYPVNILKKAGVDLTTTEPYDNTTKLFAQLVDEYERLLSQK